MGVPELNIEEQIQSMTNSILDQLRILYQQFTESNVNHMQAYSKIDGIKSSVEDLRYKIGEYVLKVSEGLLYSNLYLDIIMQLEKVSQNIGAASYRFGVLISRVKSQDHILLNLSISMVEKLIAATTNLIESVRLLSVNAKKSSEKARNVIKIEEEIDDLYRNFELKLFEKQNGDMAFLMLSKDVADRLEDCADLLRDAANDIMYLSFLRE
ncbi:MULTISPECIES: DUF47 family protein [unclassified Stygiolobus]|jgi:uncharacterized protein Yka (UPF0111/DUF47 family)|uniref:DUF47 family protein n=1 Tax=unclassified Stygiolobus TaxID=2824672 RepID=UPI000D56F6B2|nr:phosphate transport regulator [Sulfolobus sp. SCGC AB-777_G06]